MPAETSPAEDKMPTPRPSTLLSLPRELRDIILLALVQPPAEEDETFYSEWLRPNIHEILGSCHRRKRYESIVQRCYIGRYLDLISVCRQMHEEAEALFFAHARLSFTSERRHERQDHIGHARNVVNRQLSHARSGEIGFTTLDTRSGCVLNA